MQRYSDTVLDQSNNGTFTTTKDVFTLLRQNTAATATETWPASSPIGPGSTKYNSHDNPKHTDAPVDNQEHTNNCDTSEKSAEHSALPIHLLASEQHDPILQWLGQNFKEDPWTSVRRSYRVDDQYSNLFVGSLVPVSNVSPGVLMDLEDMHIQPHENFSLCL
ncbi:hypothetical protein TWF106_004103 [Orbilia oligospora]|uniref:Uncharacterized protein n=1 Tax=Orbilia oligospora TaxID=2813651 RepID=A0A6G1M2H0_ORBOL|nr:hypothetical protein TWF788_001858 [Orbilia oligospora]KAF3198815.1 hypothetical protein TWF106_004103 [Orbilia oligospora]KAF3210181.1 hypothetical protein TWF679_006930 [Orbilia oligospora]KAF3230260.1 hypothetical protein TWF191_010957 [Orbilia oligospora]KAF3241984.1 hypothetical protein TWF192_008758 [Orbilia oligospora]